MQEERRPTSARTGANAGLARRVGAEAPKNPQPGGDSSQCSWHLVFVIVGLLPQGALPKLALLSIALMAARIALVGGQVAADPFAFFRPVVMVNPTDHERLDKGEALVRMLPAREGEVGVFAAVQVKADADRLIVWLRNIAQLKKSALVLATARFSDPPQIQDLDALTLDDADLQDIRRCRPGNCGLKLGSSEMIRLQQAIAGAHGDWQPALQDAFRRLLIERVHAYLASGRAGLSPYEDHSRPVSLQAVFSTIVQRSPYLTERLPRFADYLNHYPQVSAPDVESFLYWSKEQFGGKSVVSATQLSIFRPGDDALPEVIVAGTQIFTTHYMNGSLSLTMIVRGSGGSPNYVVYLNRSQVDVVGGFFGGLVRRIIERRVKGEAVDVLQGLRRRLESGEPP